MLILRKIQKLYDGSGDTKDALHEHVDLFVDGGTIHDLRPHDPEYTPEPQDVTVDASEFTVTPGLVDCHGHITVHGLTADAMDRSNSPAAFVYAEKALYTSLVDGGVTTMRDVGGATHMMKRLVDEDVFIGPRLKIAICMLSTTGGHADFRGVDRCHDTSSDLWPHMPGRPSSIVDGPWDCRLRVRQLAGCGADWIKICTSPGVASPSDKLEHRDFTAEEIEALCDEAAGRGMKVAAHAHSASGIELAIEHGVHDIQHISFMDERLVELAHEKGCVVTPTSWVLHALLEAEGISDFVMEKAKQVAEHHAHSVQYAAAGGLKILTGTDPVLPGMHGRNYMEIAHLMDEGVATLRAWHGGTGLPAAEVGQPDTGVLEAGKRADLLICRGDVIGNPRLMGEGALVEVVKDGVGYRGGVDAFPQRTYRDTVDTAFGVGEQA